MIRLLGLSGSLRGASTNSQLVRAAARVTGPGVVLTLFEEIGGLPHFNPDLDGDIPPVEVRAWRTAVAAADGLFISSPEYAHGVPGTLKNALDWLVSGMEIVGMPVALVNASPTAVHAQAALREILTTMSALVVPEASIRLPLIGKGWDEARILADAGIAPPLRACVAALAQAGAAARSGQGRLILREDPPGARPRPDDMEFLLRRTGRGVFLACGGRSHAPEIERRARTPAVAPPRGECAMPKKSVPEPIQRFLASDRIVVAGVSRDPHQAANHIYRKLRTTHSEVLPVNPAARYVEGDHCFPTLEAVPGRIDAVMIATPPEAAPALVEQCARLGIHQVWLHRSFGPGSVSEAAVEFCHEHGIAVIVGACPMMYVEPVDIAHRCFKWITGGPAQAS